MIDNIQRDEALLIWSEKYILFYNLITMIKVFSVQYPVSDNIFISHFYQFLAFSQLKF